MGSELFSQISKGSVSRQSRHHQSQTSRRLSEIPTKLLPKSRLNPQALQHPIMPRNHPINKNTLNRWLERIQILEHRTRLRRHTLVNTRLTKIIRLLGIKRHHKNIPPHRIISFINSRLTPNPGTQINQIRIQRLIILSQRSRNRITVSLNNLRLQLLNAAEIVHHNTAIRPIRKVSGMRVAMNALKAE